MRTVANGFGDVRIAENARENGAFARVLGYFRDAEVACSNHVAPILATGQNRESRRESRE
jgi:hypothetical protein